MKVQNLNKSSQKTRKLIKSVFAEMLSEKRELGKITVSELVKRADINRGTFYSHYDDIYAVAEDYENELVENFFSNAELIASTNAEKFIDSFFSYVKQNDENYRMLCKSDDFLLMARKLTHLAVNKLTELCRQDKRIKNRDYLETEIEMFVLGLTLEYVKCCRGLTSLTLADLYGYTKYWLADFTGRRYEG